jgi:hypothetical protein
MYLNQLKESKTGRILLTFQETFRVKGKNKTRMVERLGYLDEFTDIYDDPIAHFKEVAKKRTLERKVKLSVNLEEHYTFDSPYTKSGIRSHHRGGKSYDLGFLVLSQIYHELELDHFINNRRRYTKVQFNHNTIFQMLVYPAFSEFFIHTRHEMCVNI